MAIEKRWMTCQETAEYLHLATKSVYRACARRQIPFAKIKGIGLRIDKRELDAQMEREGMRPGGKQ